MNKVLKEGLGIDMEGSSKLRGLFEYWPPCQVSRDRILITAWEKVLRAARERHVIEWEDVKLSVFPNTSRELAEKRKMFLPSKKALQQLNVRYMLAFPATLRFTWKGRNRIFTNTEEVECFINTLRNDKT